MNRVEGTFCLVLHSHLPWLAGHGVWPVGEEWLHQAWAHSYLPVVAVLQRLAAQGRTDLLTLGVTPVLAAQLDDPTCLREAYGWLGRWQQRASGLAGRPEPHLRELAAYEWRTATTALDAFERGWRHGGSPVLRGLADTGAVELLGGPATHVFQPLVDPRVAAFALRTGLDDAVARWGHRPAGIWAPECAYAPGLERLYTAAGVRRFVVDGPTLLGVGASPAAAWTVGGSDVVAFGRDLEVAYRVWSPRRGYPGDRAYRDFHTWDHDSGVKPARVTGRDVPPEGKAPYDPARAAAVVARDVADFVAVVRRRLAALAAQRDGRPGLVVAAYDTELFGHWWHEGPAWLEGVLRALPAAGVRVTTLRGAVEAGHVEGRVDPRPGSWGLGKDFRIWAGPEVAGLAARHAAVQRELLALVDTGGRHRLERWPAVDSAARQALLCLASDWAFMVSHGSAADYARRRADEHAAAFAACAAAGGGERPAADSDRLLGHLDARLLAAR